MYSREKTAPFTPPYPRFTSFFAQYVDGVMSLTYQYPNTMKNAVYGIGGASILLASSYFTSSLITDEISPIITGFASVIGITGTFASAITGFMQHKIFGFPADSKPVYKEDSYSFREGYAKLSVDEVHVPRLEITAANYFDAGYVEGYILGNAIKANLNAIDLLFQLIHVLTGFPNETEFKAYFAETLPVIPKKYVAEMRGKVAGYNAWLSAADSHA